MPTGWPPDRWTPDDHGFEKDGPVARDDLADDPGRGFRMGIEVADDGVGVVFGDDEDQSDPHVEDAVHLGERD